MAKSNSIPLQIRKKIVKIYPENDNSNLKNLLNKWTGGDFSIKILGNGFSFANWFSKKEQTSWQQRTDRLEDFIRHNCDSSNYIILFDELDEDYKDTFEKADKNEYIQLLTSLFKATQDVRSVMSKANKNIFPVVFLRHDIFDLITDSDKNKWRDLTTYLEWNINEIKFMLKHRISRIISNEDGGFDNIWYTIFDNSSIPFSGKTKSLNSFDYITRSTHGRPRDYIFYLQECAKNQLESGAGRICETIVRESDKAYSNYLKSELIDEIHGLVPDIAQIFGLFTQIRKWIMSIDEFRVIHKKYYDGGQIKTKDSDFILQMLFYFSVIGNVTKHGNIHIFKHENPEAVLNFNENIVIHRGLMKALQIL